MYIGELISIGVAFSWTLTALSSEYASKRMGSVQTNFTRLFLAMVLTGFLLLARTGSMLPLCADNRVWFWMGLSGLVGFAFGDFCLFYSYVVIGARFGQLFMTLAPVAAAIFGYFLLGESMGTYAIAGMVITILGISTSILGKNDRGRTKFKLPLKGILLGIGAGTGQGAGLVLSKTGMNLYYEQASSCSTTITDMVPFAAGEIRMFVGTGVFFLVLLLTGKIRSVKPVATDFRITLSIICSAVFGPFLGVAFSLLALHYAPSGTVSTLTALTPILIIPFAVVLQKQKVTFREIAGAVISIIGVSLFFV